MKIYERGIQTKRAFIAYDNIQHISWEEVNADSIEMKIYSASGTPIIQTSSRELFVYFMEVYMSYMGCVREL